MTAPFVVKDLGELAGAWPIIRNQDLNAYSQAPNSLDPRATLLGFRRQPSIGFLVGSAAIDITRDVASVPTTTQVTFTPGNKSLADVISEINAALGATVAFDDNGFLRLTSPTIGGDSYIRVDSVLGNEVTPYFLGLIEGQEARGGDPRQAQHIDPFRAVAGSKQVSHSVGESLDSSSINRGFFQVGYNAGAANAQLSVGRRTRKVRETIVANGELGLQIGTGSPTKGVFVGNTTTPSATQIRSLVRVLDSNGEEYTRRVFGSVLSTQFGIEVIPVPGTTGVAKLRASFSATPAVGRYFRFTTAAGGLESRPRQILSLSSNEVVIEALDDSTGGTIQFAGTGATAEIVEGYLAPAVITGIYNSFTPPLAFGSRVEGVQSTISGTSGTISFSSKGNRVNMNIAAPGMSSAQAGDLFTISSAGTSIPWSNDGTYRIQRVLDNRNVDLVNSDYTPAIINPDTTGGIGSGVAQQDGNFFRQPFIRFAPEGDPGAGGGAVPASGEIIIIEYYIEDTYTDILSRDGDFGGPLDSDTGVTSALVERMNAEHDDQGYSKAIFPTGIHVRGVTTDPVFAARHSSGGGIALYQSPSLGGVETEDIQTRLGLGSLAIGDFAGANASVQTPRNAVPAVQFTPDSDSFLGAGLDVWMGYPQVGAVTANLDLPANGSSRLWLSGEGVRATQFLASGVNTTTSPASLYMGYRRDSDGSNPDDNTFFNIKVAGDSSQAVMSFHFLGMNTPAGIQIWELGGVDQRQNMLTLHSGGGVGVNLGVDPSSTSAFDGEPEAPLHVRARPLGGASIPYEILRMEGTFDVATMSFKPALATPILSLISLYEAPLGSGDRKMVFGFTPDAATQSTGPDGVPAFEWRSDTGVNPLDTAGRLLMELKEPSFGAPELNFPQPSTTIGLNGASAALNMTGEDGTVNLTGRDARLNITGDLAQIDMSGSGSTATFRQLIAAFDPTTTEVTTPFILVPYSDLDSDNPVRVAVMSTFRPGSSNVHDYNLYFARGGDLLSTPEPAFGTTPGQGVMAMELGMGARYDAITRLWARDNISGGGLAGLWRFGIGDGSLANTDKAIALYTRDPSISNTWNDGDDPTDAWRARWFVIAQDEYVSLLDASDFQIADDGLTVQRSAMEYDQTGINPGFLNKVADTFDGRASAHAKNIPNGVFIRRAIISHSDITGANIVVSVINRLPLPSGAPSDVIAGTTTITSGTVAGQTVIDMTSSPLQKGDNNGFVVTIDGEASAVGTFYTVELVYTYYGN